MNLILQATHLSLWVALCSTLFTVPLGLVCATWLFGSRWRPLEAVFLIPLFLPPTVTGFVLLWILSPRNLLGKILDSLGSEIIFTLLATILACVVVSFPLAFQAVMVGLSRVDKEHLECGDLLGGTRVFNVLRIVWPQLRGSIAVAALLVFARSMGEFGASMMVGGNIVGQTQTLPLAVYSFAQSGDYRMALVATLVSISVAVVVYLVLRFLEKRS